MEGHESQETISAHLDGQCPPLESDRVRRHLDACAGCVRVARELSGLKDLLRSSPRIIMPEDLKSSLLRWADAKEPSKDSWWSGLASSFSQGWFWKAPAFGLAVLSIVAGLAFWRTGKNAQVPIETLLSAHQTASEIEDFFPSNTEQTDLNLALASYDAQ